MDESGRSDRVRPDYAAPPRRSFLLLWWTLLLATVVAGKWVTIGTFQTGRWDAPEPTLPERLWFDLPLVLIAGISTAFYWAARRYVAPERRTGVRAWGLVATAGALIVCLGLSLLCYLAWYSD